MVLAVTFDPVNHFTGTKAFSFPYIPFGQIQQPGDLAVLMVPEMQQQHFPAGFGQFVESEIFEAAGVTAGVLIW